ncbi:MAG: beta-L-arabinofuranosidase domain-containing protein [Capsulimonas sp.]|uniref:beta-L-arabinofuranosidase domain-containing protein n=1 Tax=Capsulimonas sp. TaxID=2494211 RepID=UPI0032631751
MSPTKFEMTRRQFIQFATISAAMLLTAEQGGRAATPLPLKTRSYAALQDLPAGSINPQGWLRTYMEKQAEHLGSKLTQVSWPFTVAYWKGEEQGELWWPWEQMAYWVDGATRLAIVMNDKSLMRQVREKIDYTVSHANSDGYLGPKFFEEPTGDFHRWPHAVFFRGLAAASDASGETEIAEAMRKHYLSDKAAYGKPTRNVVNIETMLWCYERTGDPQLLALAENSWREYLTVADDKEHGDLSELRVFSATPIDAHGVTYMETAKQPAILYAHTGKTEYLKFALAAQRRVFDHHMLIDGIPSTSEWYRTKTSLDSHETCDISDHTWSWGYLLTATGDGVWGDRIERACFNAGPGAIKNDWKALQYFSCPNQFLATLNSDHNVMAHGGHMMAYQPNPGQRTACCGGNVHRLLPNYVMRMWMKQPDGGLAATLYGPSKLTTTVGPDHDSLEIVQTTGYPFEEQIHFTIDLKRAVAFPLSLRIPEWCENPNITLNGKPISTPHKKNGFVTLNRTFQPGDKITLTLPMKTAVSHWPQNGVGLEHGPLVYSLPIEANWTPIVEERYTTAEYPSWNATPTSAWNYGVVVDEAKLKSSVKFERKPIPEDPWSNPPTRLIVSAKKIEDWELQVNPDNPNQKFTPPLPDVSASKVADSVEHLTLVPYGSTHLRVTIFPDLG